MKRNPIDDPHTKKLKRHLLPFTQVNSPPTSKNIGCKSNLLVWKRKDLLTLLILWLVIQNCP